MLTHKRTRTYADALLFLTNKNLTNINSVLLDLQIENIADIKKIISNNPNLIFFNVSDPNNILRKQICLKNFFNTYPSNSMLTDAISLYLVKKNLKKS